MTLTLSSIFADNFFNNEIGLNTIVDKINLSDSTICFQDTCVFEYIINHKDWNDHRKHSLCCYFLLYIKNQSHIDLLLLTSDLDLSNLFYLFYSYGYRPHNKDNFLKLKHHYQNIVVKDFKQFPEYDLYVNIVALQSKIIKLEQKLEKLKKNLENKHKFVLKLYQEYTNVKTQLLQIWSDDIHNIDSTYNTQSKEFSSVEDLLNLTQDGKIL